MVTSLEDTSTVLCLITTDYLNMDYGYVDYNIGHPPDLELDTIPLCHEYSLFRDCSQMTFDCMMLDS